MHELTKALDDEIDALELVLLRLSSLRLALATSRSRSIDRGLLELEASVTGVEDAAGATAVVLHTARLGSVSEAIRSMDADTGAATSRRLATTAGLRRDVRSALTSSATMIEQALRHATSHLEGSSGSRLLRTSRRHPFLMGA